jgi:hypothetical protein
MLEGRREPIAVRVMQVRPLMAHVESGEAIHEKEPGRLL